MLKLDCTLVCEVCSEELAAYIELEDFGSAGPGLGDLFGSLFSGGNAPRYSIKGKKEEISSWTNVGPGLKFTCKAECKETWESKLKAESEVLDAAHKWTKEIKKQSEINVNGSELPDWFWEALKAKATEENPLCQHEMPVDEPGAYRLRGGVKKSAKGFFTTKTEGFWIWHEPSDTSRHLELTEYSTLERIVRTDSKIVEGQPT